MSSFLFRERSRNDRHARVQVFAGRDADHRASVGELTLALDEWISLRGILEVGADPLGEHEVQFDSRVPGERIGTPRRPPLGPPDPARPGTPLDHSSTDLEGAARLERDLGEGRY